MEYANLTNEEVFMSKAEFIKYIEDNFFTYLIAANYFRSERMGGYQCLRSSGWLLSYDGPNIEDIYFCSRNPMGDDEGETISFSEINIPAK